MKVQLDIATYTINNGLKEWNIWVKELLTLNHDIFLKNQITIFCFLPFICQYNVMFILLIHDFSVRYSQLK